jgi:hypothetical protein
MRSRLAITSPNRMSCPIYLYKTHALVLIYNYRRPGGHFLEPPAALYGSKHLREHLRTPLDLTERFTHFGCMLRNQRIG